MSAPVAPATRPFAGFHLLALRQPRATRVWRLIVGLSFFGIALAMAVEARLGTNPWTVFHEGSADRLGTTFGTTVILTGLAILIALRFLHEPLGLGTMLNVAIIGPVADLALWAIPEVDSLWVRVPLLIGSPIVLGFGSGLYLGAGIGPGPRDGLMTALSRRGIATWRARTLIELSALAIGWLLGGRVGLGTIWIALAIGPSVGFFLPWCTVRDE